MTRYGRHLRWPSNALAIVIAAVDIGVLCAAVPRPTVLVIDLDSNTMRKRETKRQSKDSSSSSRLPQARKRTPHTTPGRDMSWGDKARAHLGFGAPDLVHRRAASGVIQQGSRADGDVYPKTGTAKGEERFAIFTYEPCTRLRGAIFDGFDGS